LDVRGFITVLDITNFSVSRIRIVSRSNKVEVGTATKGAGDSLRSSVRRSHVSIGIKTILIGIIRRYHNHYHAASSPMEGRAGR